MDNKLDNHLDFEVIQKQSIKLLQAALNQNIINPSEDLNDTQQARLGFYYLALSIDTNETDLARINEMMIDTEYLQLTHGVSNDDLGVDAVYIDEEHHIVNLYNFKYRTLYKPQSKIKCNPITDSNKFIAGLDPKVDINTIEAGHSTKHMLKAIRKAYDDGKTEWSTRLVLVSNEDLPFRESDLRHYELSMQQNQYTVDCIVLPDLVDALISKPAKSNKGTIQVQTSECMKYAPATSAVETSYLVKMTMADVLRLFSTDEDLREDCMIQDYEKLRNLNVDHSLFFDNVRGFLKKSKFNKNIKDTLCREPEKFFFYNNGLTIICNRIKAEDINGGHRKRLSIEGYQAVNGGQTVRSMFNANVEDFSEERLENVAVLARIYPTENADIRFSISEYTNSQNAISPIDLKSTDPLQHTIEQSLKSDGITYIRKVGDWGIVPENSTRVLRMETLGQILYAVNGSPHRATSLKKQIFDERYDILFNPSDDFLEKVTSYANAFLDNNERFHCTLQENLYLLYVQFKECINGRIDNQTVYRLLRDHESQFETEKELSAARKLLLTTFKDSFDDKIEAYLAALATDSSMDQLAVETSKTISQMPYSKLQLSLREALLDLRVQLATENGKKPANIITVKTIDILCDEMPSSIAELWSIDGMGPTRINQYGNRILELIRSYHNDSV